MNRLFLSAALLPLAYAVSAQAETKISTAVTTPVATATAASGQPDSITIETAGSIKPTAAGAAVTVNSNHAVKNGGTISFNNIDNATGILVQGGRATTVTNTGTISLVEDYTYEDTDKDGDHDGPFAKGSNRFGIRVAGEGAFTGEIRNDRGGAIGVEGNDSGGIRVDTRLIGNLVNAGTIQVYGDRSVGVQAGTVEGDVRMLGQVSALGEGSSALVLDNVTGVVQLQNTITATGFRSTERLSDAARAKLDADDLKMGGAAVRITGDVGKGVLLDAPPADKSATDKDEDKDGIEDSLESTAGVASYGSAAAIDLGSGRATTIGAVGAGEDAYGLINRGQVLGNGVNDGVAATAIRIGQAGGGATNVVGGLNNQGGTIRAIAYGGENAAQGGATGILVNAGASLPAIRNSGTIEASLNGGPQGATAVLDKSGSLKLVENTGVIRATTSAKTGSTARGQAVALDLSANTTGATVRQTKATSTSTPAIVGDVLFGAGADRLELLGGSLTGDLSFGSGADTLLIDGGASAAGRLIDSDGQLTVDLREGRLALANKGAVQMSALSVGAKGVLAVTVDPLANQATQLNVSGAATLASGSKVEVGLTSLLKDAKSYEIIRAGSLSAPSTGLTLAGAPYLYAAGLKTSGSALVLDLRPKTAAELGLNRSGAEAYSAVFAALPKNAGIESAFLAQTDKAGFMDLYDQMLPDHSGGALMSAHAISGAISQAVARPVARTGEAYSGVWAQEILFHIDRDRDQAQGFKSQGFGLASGVEALGQYNALGLSGSFVSTDYKDQGAAAGERISMNFFEAGLYWRFQAGGLAAEARTGLGYVSFDSERLIASKSVNLSTKAEWNGWLVDGHLGAAYEGRMGAFHVRPELSLDYLRLREKGYEEKGAGAGFDLKVDERTGHLLTGEALLALGARFGAEFSWGPEVKVGWRTKLAGDPGVTTARFSGGEAFKLHAEDLAAGGAVARLGVFGEGSQFAYSIDVGGVFDDGYREYDLRAVVRFLF
jgi:hypothetical protein